MKRKLPGTVVVIAVVLLVTTYLLNKIKTFIRAIEHRFIWHKTFLYTIILFHSGIAVIAQRTTLYTNGIFGFYILRKVVKDLSLAYQSIDNTII